MSSRTSVVVNWQIEDVRLNSNGRGGAEPFIEVTFNSGFSEDENPRLLRLACTYEV